MKRILVLLSVLLVSLSLFASVGAGYSLSPVGEKFGDEHFGGASLSFYFSPTGLRNIGKVEADLLFSMKGDFFKGVNLTLSSPLFQSVSHPFNYIFSNKVLWQPTLGVGAEYRVGEEIRMMVEISPFVFQDAAFMYEILSPYFSLDRNGEWGWGITIMKFSASYGRVR